MHQDLKVKLLGLTYNYSPLIEYYYDMNSVAPRIVKYKMETFPNPDHPTIKETYSQDLTPPSPSSSIEIYAYEDRDIFGAWKAREISTGDSNTKTGSPAVRIKMNGRKIGTRRSESTVVLKASCIKIGFKITERKNIQTTVEKLSLIIKENAVVYKKQPLSLSIYETPFSATIARGQG
jgi:hypothetical protein